MLKVFLLFGLFIVGFILQNCNSTTSVNIQSKIETNVSPQPTETPQEQETKILLPATGKVEFKGVNFSYDAQVFGEPTVEENAELPLEDETYKPDSVAPKHLLFKLKNSELKREAVIYVFPIKEYRRMFAISSSLTKIFDEQLEGLRKVIKDKNFRLNNQIPFIPFWDGSQTFQTKVKHASFQNGNGIFFLTQFDIEVSLINNEGLVYVFQGITEDNKNYILAKFPIRVSFLPESYYAKELEGYKLPERGFIETDKELKQYEKHVSMATKRLENLPPDEFEPNLKYLEEIISSLKVEK